MVHDPCNPLPESYIPSGLSLPSRHQAAHVGAHFLPRTPQGHAVVVLPPTYIGCDHHAPATTQSWRISPVDIPAFVELPAITLLRSTAFTVATIPNFSPLLESPDDSGIAMPEPSGAAMFLFAALIAWAARHVDRWHWRWPVIPDLGERAMPDKRRRHRNRPIAQYRACRTTM